ncbi:hypothetical protein FRB94_008419 [Tulasnella sp. JGI-2019a]|nr:hypothetical protein FRB93_008124 [Tulasnella sp. JGI-2019a]KAG8996298.1 hypothetical protein FRB94_008419 [Tulasnella sp. JGI-2019a]
MPGIESPGATGVIYCTDRAMAHGFTYDNSDWANFGQGAPETGPLPDAPPRPETVTFSNASLEYGPTTGVKDLRTAVANLYNVTYRKGMESQYTADNVCIVPGGRAGLTRVAAVVGDVYTGYQIPDYSAYSEMLSSFRRLIPVPTALKVEDRYNLNIEQVKNDINVQGLQVLLASNPRNPTGQVIRGDDLKRLVEISEGKTTVILDEFYSWYLYPEPGKENEYEFGQTLSAASYVRDVDEDHVVIVDGLTKNFRLPGWRVCWVIGPKCLITALSQSGSYLDGGANHPLQLAAIPLLDPEHVAKERVALQKHFLMKRNHVLDRLEKMGLRVEVPPVATFYIWLDLSKLPKPLDNGLTFFEECLKEKTIVVPGIFFDLNPSHRRDLFSSPCHHFVRLSFGPPLPELDKGLDAIERILTKARTVGMGTFGQNLPASPTMKKIAKLPGEGKSLLSKITGV